MVTPENLNNAEFIIKVEHKINEEISKIIDSLMLKEQVVSLIGAIRLEILKNKGVLRYMGEMVSLEDFIIDTDLPLNIYNDTLFDGLVNVLIKHKRELTNRGFHEYKALKMWSDGNTEPLNLRLTSFKEVRTAIINEIKKDSRITLYIESYEQTFS